MAETMTQHANAGVTNASDPLIEIASLVKLCGSVSSFFARAFRALACDLNASYVVGAVRDGAVGVDESYGSGSGGWSEAADQMTQRVIADGSRLMRVYRSADDVAVLAVSCPIVDERDAVIGAITALFRCDEAVANTERTKSVERLAAALASGVALMRAKGGVAQSSTMVDESAHSAVVRSSDYRSIHQLAFAITNNLRARLEADIVAFGVPKGHGVKVLSVSGHDEVKRRSPGSVPIRLAMEETADFGRVICYQLDDTWAGTRMTTGHRLHRAWHEESGGCAVLSVPLEVAGELVGVVSVKRPASKPFSIDEVEEIAATVQPFGVGLDLVTRASRGVVSHVGSSVNEVAHWVVRPGSWGRKATLFGALSLAAWISYGDIEHRLTVPASVSSPGARVLTAPYSGALSEVRVRNGARVSEGEVIATMNTAGLESELKTLRAQEAGFEIQVSQALALEDRTAAVRADAELAIVNAQIETLEERIRRSEILAPFDGVVLSLQAEDRIGEVFSLGAPVLTVAPDDGLEVEISLPEWAAGWVKSDTQGAFVPRARPGSQSPLSVRRVMPAAEVVQGKLIVRASASVYDTESWVLPGMSGTARLHLGDRPVWWVGFHRAIDTIRMRFWL